jgi:hypothetical protein
MKDAPAVECLHDQRLSCAEKFRALIQKEKAMSFKSVRPFLVLVLSLFVSVMVSQTWAQTTTTGGRQWSDQ